MALSHLKDWAANRIYVPPLLLGSAIAAGLSMVGVSEDRVKKITGTSDCGCKERARKLDAIGVAAAKIVERAANWALASVVPYEVTDDDVAVLSRAIYDSPLTNPGLKSRYAAGSHQQRPQTG
jgi:hypothetical protein